MSEITLSELPERWRTLASQKRAGATGCDTPMGRLLITEARSLESCADALQPFIDREQAQRQEAIHCRECDLEVPDNGDLVCCDCVRELQDTVQSIAMMLGWGNVPPREMLERDINALKSQVESLQQEIARLKTDWRARAREFTKLFKESDEVAALQQENARLKAAACSLCSIDDGLVREWVMKARDVARSKGLLPLPSPPSGSDNT